MMHSNDILELKDDPNPGRNDDMGWAPPARLGSRVVASVRMSLDAATAFKQEFAYIIKIC